MQSQQRVLVELAANSRSLAARLADGKMPLLGSLVTIQDMRQATSSSQDPEEVCSDREEEVCGGSEEVEDCSRLDIPIQ